MTITALALTIPLIAFAVAPSSAASPARDRKPSLCQQCSACTAEFPHPRVVGLKMYNQPRISETSLDQILDVTNRIWNPYGVSFESSTSADAIAVILSPSTSPAAGSGATVLGDTLFTGGHATPYIHLFMGNAEALAVGAEIEGRSFISRPRVERDAILLQMLGVALAHELAHYLLDTTHHSAVGLLRGTLSVDDMAHPNPDHLRLTREQRRLMCVEGNTSH